MFVNLKFAKRYVLDFFHRAKAANLRGMGRFLESNKLNLIFSIGAVISVVAFAENETSAPAKTAISVYSNMNDPAVWMEAAAKDSVYMVMNKEKSELRVHSLEDGHLYGSFRAISGSNPGDKEKEGDRKTPEGIYFITRPIPKAQLSSIHGPEAFEIGFPNYFDFINHRGGSGIWVHGVDREDRLKKGTDTRGCVALSNKDVVLLHKIMKYGETPIIIVNQEKGEDTIGLENTSGPYAQRVDEWRKAWSSRDVNNYLNFYHPSFKNKKMDLAAWGKYKARLAKTYQRIDVTLDRLRILRHPKYNVALFRQSYQSDKIQAQTYKKLMLVGNAADAKILREENLQDDTQYVEPAADEGSVVLTSH